MLVSGFLKLRRPYTVTGLAVWLDTSRQTHLEYEVKPEFLDTVNRAKQRIENYAEEKLFDSDYPIRGVIFSLSNNARGWAEKREDTVKIPKDGAEELAARLLGANTDSGTENLQNSKTKGDGEPKATLRLQRRMLRQLWNDCGGDGPPVPNGGENL